VRVDQFALRLDSSNALEIFVDYDVIVDGTDNFPTRYLSNDACVLLGKPNVYGSIYRFEGQASVFDAKQGPCYRCLYPEPPPPGAVPSCEEGGVLGVLPGMVAIIQATETVKLLIGVGRSLVGRLLAYDALAMEWNEFRLKKDPECPVCGPDPTVTELIDYQGFCGFNPSETDAPGVVQVSAADLRARLEGPGDMLLLDVREPEEVAKASIEGARAVPLADLEARLGEIEAWRDRPVVVHCHHGGRSAQACAELARLGFSQVENLDGGIEAWSLTVDDGVPRY
jgi:adenylyltransferase/sulfurtransferase